MAMSHLPIIHILHSRVALDLAPLKPVITKARKPFGAEHSVGIVRRSSRIQHLHAHTKRHRDGRAQPETTRQWRCLRGRYKGAMMPHESTVSRPEASATGTRYPVHDKRDCHDLSMERSVRGPRLP